ncbi:envelope stress response protein PspG [Vibrio sp. SS-MA-C1-2]|uniref:envelope stress response protein PspG n=1 Tax=Vibrio sp. SS-MA-C1-2 TaxID=2908646 RepID=UPI001F2B3D69|nr:envelope stress response protein PspG [Vibrio sp. SS-MA-C1-2]UJF19552.1 envelope stress response protein PspG [Vibrio sp. SS-MA-C1-2]
MFELLFLIGFAMILVMTGVSVVGIIVAMIVGFIIMAIAGMVGLIFKLLPWILLICVAVWFYNDKKGKKSDYYSSYRDR